MQKLQLISLTYQCIHNVFIFLFLYKTLYNHTTAFTSQQKFSLRLDMYTLYHGKAPEHLHKQSAYYFCCILYNLFSYNIINFDMYNSIASSMASIFKFWVCTNYQLQCRFNSSSLSK
jgi:hypothetical protein